MEQNLEPRQPDTQPESDDAVSRRAFLRNSVYAAYATPLITALLVERASAARSKTEEFCAEHPNHPLCQ